MSAQTGETVDGYTLESLELEYETMDSQIYSQGVPNNRYYDEANRLFGNGAENPLMPIISFLQKALRPGSRPAQHLPDRRKAHLNTIEDTTRNSKEGYNRGRRLSRFHHLRRDGMVQVIGNMQTKSRHTQKNGSTN